MTQMPVPPETPKAPAPSGASRTTRLVLALSLAANLAVAGFVIGGVAGRGGPGGHRGMPGDLSFGPFTEAMDDQDRQALREALFSKAPDMRDARKRMAEDLAGLVRALQADPFDPAALDAAFAAQNQRMAGNLAIAQSVLRDFLIGMTPEARAAFAARLAERLPPSKQ